MKILLFLIQLVLLGIQVGCVPAGPTSGGTSEKVVVPPSPPTPSPTPGDSSSVVVAPRPTVAPTPIATASVTPAPQSNHLPVISGSALTFSTSEDVALNLTLRSASDSDIGDTERLTYNLINYPMGALNGCLNNTNDLTCTYTPNSNWSGTDSFTYAARDFYGLSNIMTVVITVSPVNDLPVLTNTTTNSPYVVPKRSSSNILSAIYLSTTDVETSSTNIIYTITDITFLNGVLRKNVTVLSTVAGSNTFTQADINAGIITYENTTGQPPLLPAFNFSVKDNNNYTISNQVFRFAIEANSAPTFSSTTLALTVNEGASDFWTLSSATDRNNDVLTYELVDAPVHGTLSGCLDGSSDLICIYTTRDVDFNGIDSFTYRAFDGQLYSANKRASITILPVNDTPNISYNPAFCSASSIVVQDGETISCSVAGTDVSDGDDLSLADVVSDCPGLVFNRAGDDSGSISWTAALANTGCTFSFTVTDNGAPALSRTVSKSFSVTAAVNTPPVFSSATQSIVTSILEDAQATALATLDAANDADAGDTLTYSLVSAPVKGSLSACLGGTSDRDCFYRPNLNANGVDTFVYKANDGRVDSSNQVTVTITITAVNDPPTFTTTPAICATSINMNAAYSCVFNTSDIDLNVVSVSISANTCTGLALAGNTVSGSVSTAGECSYQINMSDGTATTTSVQRINVIDPRPTETWTIFVYGHADHNLSASLLTDLAEMNAAVLNANVNVILMQDLNDSSYASGTKWYLIQGGGAAAMDLSTHVDASKRPPLSMLLEQNLDQASTLSNSVEWVFTTFPAQNYGVILWDHGGSWFGGFGGDNHDAYGEIPENERSTLLTKDIATAVIGGLAAAGISSSQSSPALEFFAFDTCLMGGVESAYDFISLSKTYLAAPELDYGAGFDYQTFLTFLAANTGATANEIVYQEVADWNNHHRSPQSLDPSDELFRAHSAFDLTKLPAVTLSWKSFTDSLLANTTSAWSRELANFQYKTRPGYLIMLSEIETDAASGDILPTRYSYGIRDAGQFLTLLSSSSSNQTIRGLSSSLLTTLFDSNNSSRLIRNTSLGTIRSAANQRGMQIELASPPVWQWDMGNVSRSIYYCGARGCSTSPLAGEWQGMSWHRQTGWGKVMDRINAVYTPVIPVLSTWSTSNTENPTITTRPTISYLFSTQTASANADIAELNAKVYITLSDGGVVRRYRLGETAYTNVLSNLLETWTWNGCITGISDSSGDGLPIDPFQWEDGLWAARAEIYDTDDNHSSGFIFWREGSSVIDALGWITINDQNLPEVEIYSLDENFLIGWTIYPKLYDSNSNDYLQHTDGIEIPASKIVYVGLTGFIGNFDLEVIFRTFWGTSLTRNVSITSNTEFCSP